MSSGISNQVLIALLLNSAQAQQQPPLGAQMAQAREAQQRALSTQIQAQRQDSTYGLGNAGPGGFLNRLVGQDIARMLWKHGNPFDIAYSSNAAAEQDLMRRMAPQRPSRSINNYPQLDLNRLRALSAQRRQPPPPPANNLAQSLLLLQLFKKD